MDVMSFLVAVPIPFIFGTIITLNMLEGNAFQITPAASQRIVQRISAA